MQNLRDTMHQSIKYMFGKHIQPRSLGLWFGLALLLIGIYVPAQAADSVTDPALDTLPAIVPEDIATGAGLFSEFTFTLNDPPNNQPLRVAEGEDYATLILGNPWDMSESTDIRPVGPMNRNTHQGFRDVSFENGVFRGVTISNDSYFWLLHQGYPLANNIAPYSGLGAPIDAARFSHLSFRLARNGAGPEVPLRIYWYKAGDEATGQPSGISRPIMIQNGWNVYSLDLSNPANVEVGSWSGQITGLRIDPTSTSFTHVAGVEVLLDWARLVNPATVGQAQTAWQSDLREGQRSLVSVSLIERDSPLRTPPAYTVGAGLSTRARDSLAWNTAGVPPGHYDVRAQMGIDYAGVVLNDPWDFDGMHDIARLENFQGVSLQGSTFRGQTATNDAQMLLRVDPNQPIDTATFRYLAFRINPSAMAFVNAMWTRVGDPGPWGGMTQFTRIEPGWQTVLIDLQDPENLALGAWSGQVSELRLDPATAAGIQIEIAWVGLLTTGSVPQTATDLEPIVTYAQEPVIVQSAPVLNIVAPSMTSGDDYATTVLGRPWNFRDEWTVARTEELINIQYGPNGMSATVQEGLHSGCLADCGDAQIWLRVGSTPDTYIDADRFKYVTFRYRQDGWQDVYGGWATRFLWTPTMFPFDTSTLDDVVPWDGWPTYTPQDSWHTYQFNLKEMQLEGEGAVPGQSNPGWNNSRGRIAQFRFDPTEVAYASNIYVDYIKLTADPVSRGQTVLRWQVENTDAPTTVRIYSTTSPRQAGLEADNDTRAADDTLIATVQPGRQSYEWDTREVPQGTYYIKFVADDGYNTTTWYSEVPIIVAAPRTDNAKHRIFAPAMQR